MDPAWPHLQGIYEFFLQLVINESVEVRSLKVYVTPQFVQEFLDLFDSEESVERDYLKNILHKLYAKVRNKPKFVIKIGQIVVEIVLWICGSKLTEYCDWNKNVGFPRVIWIYNEQRHMTNFNYNFSVVLCLVINFDALML